MIKFSKHSEHTTTETGKIHSNFSAFNCCCTVVLSLETGAYTDNSHVLYCHISIRFTLLCVLILFLFRFYFDLFCLFVLGEPFVVLVVIFLWYYFCFICRLTLQKKRKKNNNNSMSCEWPLFKNAAIHHQKFTPLQTYMYKH